MDYAEVRAAFFSPRDVDSPDEPASGGSGTVSDGRRLRHVLEPIGTIHWWSEPGYDAMASVGLEFLGGYVWSRACLLGEPDPAVVVSAFGNFEPGLITSVYDQSRATCTLAQIRTARAKGAADALAACLPDTTGVLEVANVLRRAVEAADPTGRALFAGGQALPWPDEPRTALWHGANTLREFRGDCHLAAYVAAGLSGLQADLLTELSVGLEPRSYTGTRGWSPEAMADGVAALEARGLVQGDTLTADGTALRGELEATTEALVAPVLAAIGGDLDDVLARASSWSQQIIEHGWFPPDPYKRAAG